VLNPNFNHSKKQTEQDLVQDLVDESIQIHGIQTYYIKRESIEHDGLLGEDDLQTFTDYFDVEMYLKSSTSFQGQSEFISKFGLHIEDQALFIVSMRRFHEAVPNLDRPREGDLVWVQMTDANRFLFKIRFVDNKEQLFQLGKLYVYELRCEVMNFSHETVDTNVPEIDGVSEKEAYTISIEVSSGTGNFVPDEFVYQGADFATATATAKLQHAPINNVLLLRDVTGVFSNTANIKGLTSNAEWTITGNADPYSINDPIADNEELVTTANTVVISRGSNPRFS
jgi:Virus neck protein